MDMKMITLWFSRERLGGLIVASAVALVLPGSPAMADNFTSPSASVNFSASGPSAVLNMPVSTAVSNVDSAAVAGPTADQSGNSLLGGSLGAAGTQANTSYATGAAPEDAGMSGLTSNKTAQQYTNAPQMTNGLMAPFSVNPASIPLFDGLGYGFNANPAMQTYSMATGTAALINGAVNALGGGIITSGPVLPVTSTGSVNLNVTLGNGY